MKDWVGEMVEFGETLGVQVWEPTTDSPEPT